MVQIEDIIIKDEFVVGVLSTGEKLDLPAECVKIYALTRGMIIDRGGYRQLKEESERFTCLRRAMYYLSIRSRSSRELENYLVKKGFSKDHIHEATGRLKERGYLDDFAFATRYASYRRQGKTVGPRLIRNELYKKGIDKEIINRALAQAEAGETDREALFHLAVQKLQKIEQKKNPMAKLAFFLRGRGFDDGDIRWVIDRLRKGEPEM
jgi:regulatory protein